MSPLIVLAALWLMNRSKGGGPPWPVPTSPPPQRPPQPRPHGRARKPAQASKPKPQKPPAPPAPPPVPGIPAPDGAIMNPEAPPAPTPQAPAAAQKPQQRTPERAARDLYNYVVPLVNAGKGSSLGTKGAINAFVYAAERDMGLPATGIYGPIDRAKGKALLGVNFPPRVLPAQRR